MFMGFIIHFYITSGTNVLTGGPAHIVVFLPISVFRLPIFYLKGNVNNNNSCSNIFERPYMLRSFHHMMLAN